MSLLGVTEEKGIIDLSQRGVVGEIEQQGSNGRQAGRAIPIEVGVEIGKELHAQTDNLPHPVRHARFFVFTEQFIVFVLRAVVLSPQRVREEPSVEAHLRCEAAQRHPVQLTNWMPFYVN